MSRKKVSEETEKSTTKTTTKTTKTSKEDPKKKAENFEEAAKQYETNEISASEYFSILMNSKNTISES